jgi:hypothetical protein
MKEFVGGCSSLVPLFLGGKDSTLPFPITSSLTHPPTHQNNSFLPLQRKEGRTSKSQYNVEERMKKNIQKHFGGFLRFVFIYSQHFTIFRICKHGTPPDSQAENNTKE